MNEWNPKRDPRRKCSSNSPGSSAWTGLMKRRNNAVPSSWSTRCTSRRTEDTADQRGRTVVTPSPMTALCEWLRIGIADQSPCTTLNLSGTAVAGHTNRIISALRSTAVKSVPSGQAVRAYSGVTPSIKIRHSGSARVRSCLTRATSLSCGLRGGPKLSQLCAWDIQCVAAFA